MEELEIRPFDKRVSELILETPTPGRHAARSAIRHIQRAWGKRNVDRELALFQAITAQEEAVTAVMYACKRRNYAGAEKLKPRNHRHKWGLVAFLEGVQEYFAKGKDDGLMLHLTIIEHDGTDRIVPVVRVPQLPKHEIVCYPPLSAVASGPDGKVADFDVQLAEVALRAGHMTVLERVDELANTRNRVLYASDAGMPNVHYEDSLLLEYRDRLFTTLAFYLMIDPYQKHQQFVQQGLSAFLKMMKI